MGDETTLLEHRFHPRIATAKCTVGLRRILRVASAVYGFKQPLCCSRIKRVAGFGEGCKAVRFQHLGPHVNVIARSVARAGKQMLKMGQIMPLTNIRRDTECFTLRRFKLLLINRGAIGQGMQRHIDQGGAGVLHGGPGLIELTGAFELVQQR